MSLRAVSTSLVGVLLLLAAIGWREASASESGKYWIFFVDKGSRQHTTALLKSSAATAHLTERALQRRAKMATQDQVVDSRDLPVYQPYRDDLRNAGVKPIVTSRWLNAISARLTKKQLADVKQLPFVGEVRPVAVAAERRMSREQVVDPPGLLRKPSDHDLDYGLSYTQNALIHVPEVHDLGINARGVRIGMLDTGYRYQIHEAFKHLKVIAEFDFINQDTVTQNESGQDASSQHNHGTSTLGALAGFKPGSLVGPAYGAEFLLGKTEYNPSETPIEEDYWVAGIEWEEAMGADVVSSSVGYNDWYEYSDMNGDRAVTTRAADIATHKGVVVVNSAGNEGNDSWFYIIAPSDGDSVIAVGAVTSQNTLTSFSSHGPTSDGRTKPDVVAMGNSVYATGPLDTADYRSLGGTSMSCPQVAGVAALVLAAHPYLTPMEVRDALRETADRAENPDNDYGWGLVNAWKAVLYHGPAFSTFPTVSLTQSGSYDISISVAGDPAIRPDEVRLFWSTNPEELDNAVYMTPDEKADHFWTTIPQHAEGTNFYFHFSAENTSSMVHYHPFDSPGSLFCVTAGDTGVSLFRAHTDTTPQPTPTVPDEFVLHRPYPNPLSASGQSYTRIDFELPEVDRVSLKIYNILGQEVRTLVDDVRLSAKTHHFNWHGRDDSGVQVPSGVYFIRLAGEGISRVQKIAKVK